MKRKTKFILAGSGVAVAAVCTLLVVLFMPDREDKEIVYRETTVEYGTLTVGITDDAEVSIGTVEQTFDLDISALVSSNSSSSQNSGAGGMGGMGNMGGGMPMFSMGTQYASQSQSLEVSAVHVTVGQNINEGDILYTLTDESVQEIRTALEDDVDDTLNEYEALKVEQQQTKNQASQGYDTYVTNGKYAGMIYDNDISKLQEAVDDATDKVNDTQEQINETLLELQETQEELVKAKNYLKEAQAAVSENYGSRYENPYYYTVYENTRETAQALADKLEDEAESLTEEYDELLAEVQAAMRELNEANLALEKGKLSSKQTYDIDTYYSDSASEWYSIQTASIDNELETAKNSYETAKSKLDEFDAYIVDNKVLSQYNGVVTQASLDEGDYVTKGSELIVLYDSEAVTMDVALSEDDYNTIDREGAVNILYTAYPDEIYKGIISEVSDAEYDSSTGLLYYTVTVTVQGDVSGLYEGMTGDVTFVTKETKEVLYVSNRAVLRDGTRSYVKVRNEHGNIEERDVTTGFSDGVNVEILEGLSEGDIVLIEGKVS